MQDKIIKDGDIDENFRIRSFNVIIDTARSTITDRFDTLNSLFYADLSLLDPRNFEEIKSKDLKAPAKSC